MGLPADRDAVDAEFEARSDLRESRVRPFSSCEAVGDDRYKMAAIGLSVCDVEDMTDDAADRRAYGVQDTQRRFWRCRG